MASPMQEAITQQFPSWAQIAEDSLQEAFCGMKPLVERPPKVVSRFQWSDSLPSLSEWFSSGPEVCVSIKFPLGGDIDGDLVWLTSWETARIFWQTCLGHSPQTLAELSEVEIAKMLELGTQFATAFAEGFSSRSRRSVQPGPIRIAIETQAVILETVIPEAASKSPFLGCSFLLEDGDLVRIQALIFFQDLASTSSATDDGKEAA